MAVRVFYSYSHKDEKYKDDLDTQLSILKRQNKIEGWDDRKIIAGGNWKEEINLNIEKAEIVLLLISANFLASDYCYDTETMFALEQQQQGKCQVIPIIVRPCLWKESNIKHLQVLPKNGSPITTWKNRDEAWLDVANGIVKAVDNAGWEGPIKMRFSEIDFEDELFKGELGPIKNVSDLENLILSFLYRFHKFYFSPLRIQKWGSKQKGFEKLGSYSLVSIRKALDNLLKLRMVNVTSSKKGNSIYRILIILTVPLILCAYRCSLKHLSVLSK